VSACITDILAKDSSENVKMISLAVIAEIGYYRLGGDDSLTFFVRPLFMSVVVLILATFQIS
jgi:hypothetical protein